MSNRFNEGVGFFNDGRYYDAHEAWEDVWRESTGEEKLWLQGLVQVAVALHHASAGNLVGCTSVLQRALRNLSDCPQNMWGLNIVELRVNIMRSCAELDRGGQPTCFRIGLAGDIAPGVS